MQSVIFGVTVFCLLWPAFLAHSAGEGEIESEFRCGTQLVSTMEQNFQVLQKCGEPKSKETISGADGAITEKWIYESLGGYYHVLTFRDDVLIKILEVPSD